MSRTAYSYSRFSTAEQSKGDSIRRQLAATTDYCRRKGYALDTTFTLHDAGVSAWKGKNVKQGALGAFLRAVENGRVKSNSILVCESLDRISRQRPIDALALWLQILQTGVEIHTISPERQYSGESDQLAVFEAVIILSRANEESEIKSHRIAAAWRNKRTNAGKKKLTRNCPAWLELSADRQSFKVVRWKATIVKRIFKMCCQGYGSSAIARTLNQEKVKLIAEKSNSHTWYDSYIKKILHTRAVVGEYQPCICPKDKPAHPAGDPIPDYYPRVIDDATFYRAQKTLEARDNKRGRQGRFITNLFQGLIKEADGSSYHLMQRGDRPSVAPSAALRGEKKVVSFPYKVLEHQLLGHLYALPAHELFACAPDTKAIHKAIANKEAELAKYRRQLDTLRSALKTHSDVSALLDTIRDLETECANFAAAVDSLRQELHGATSNSILTDLHSLITQLSTARGSERIALRVRTREAIRALVHRITLTVNEHSRYIRQADMAIEYRNGHRRLLSICCNSRTDAVWSLSQGTDDVLTPAQHKQMQKQGFAILS